MELFNEDTNSLETIEVPEDAKFLFPWQVSPEKALESHVMGSMDTHGTPRGLTTSDACIEEARQWCRRLSAIGELVDTMDEGTTFLSMVRDLILDSSIDDFTDHVKNLLTDKGALNCA